MITNLNDIHCGEFYEARNIKPIFGCKSDSKLTEILKKAKEHGIYPISNKPKVFEGGQIKQIFNLISSGELWSKTKIRKISSLSLLSQKQSQSSSLKPIKKLVKKKNTTTKASAGVGKEHKLQANHYPTL